MYENGCSKSHQLLPDQRFQMVISPVHFSKSPILKIFLWKFHGLVLGLVELIDAKGIGVAQLL